jgi:zinc transporter ZupT
LEAGGFAVMAVAFAFILSVVAALADVLGGALTVVRKLSERQIVLATALGSGFLLGATCLDRLPDAMTELPKTAPFLIVAGYLAMLLLDKFGHGHGHAVSAADKGVVVETAHAPGSRQLVSPRAGLVTLIGMLVHTFMDGVVIAGAFTINQATGILMFLAITLHKIPEGFSMVTISLAAGESAKKAFASSVYLAISTMVGAGLTLAVGALDAPVVKVFMAVATGTFLFIATTSLIPAVKDSNEPRAGYAVILGVFFFALSLYLVKHVGLS